MDWSSGSDAAISGLVGRESDLAALRAALDTALAGHGGLVLLSGAAGIGKTALTEVLLAEAVGRGALVSVGRAYDLSETPPYGPWIEIFAQLTAALDHLHLPAPLGVGVAANRTILSEATQEALAALAGRQPLVLFLDDLHWADPPSLELLRFVARRLADLPILLLAAYRADEVARHHPLYRLLPVLVHEANPFRLDVRPLDDTAVRALLARRYALDDGDAHRLLAYLGAHAEGNPLYTGELLRTLEETGTVRRAGDRWSVAGLTTVQIPPILRQVIEGRVARLGEEVRDALTVAAAIGQKVPFGLWTAVAGVDEERLLASAERAIEADILAEGTGVATVRFTHALIREALYAGIGVLRRHALHRRVAEALLAAPRPDPDAVAYHFGRAGDERTFEWLLRAGVRARRADAWLMAIDRFAAAAALLQEDRARARERGWLLFYCGLLLRFSDNDQTIRYLDEAERLALLVNDRVLLAYARYQRGPSRCMRGEVRLGLADIEQGVAELDGLPSEYHLRSNDELALTIVETFIAADARQLPPHPVPVHTPLTSTPQRGVLVNWLGHSGRYREALTIGDAFIATIKEALGAGYTRLYQSHAGHLGRGHALAALGRPDEARQEYTLARRQFQALGESYMVEYTCWVELLMIALPYEADRVAERTALGAEAVRAWRQAGGTITTATHASLADLFLAPLEGRWVEARQLAEAGLVAPTVDKRHGSISALGMLLRWQGEPELAWAQVRTLHPAGPATQPGDCYFPHGLRLQALAADLALDAGDLPLAATWIAAHGRWLDWSGAVLWRAEQHLLLARHAQVRGDLVAAQQHAEDARASAAQPRRPLALLIAHRTLGELALSGSRHAEAERHLMRALRLAEACAAPYERALTLLALAQWHLATDAHDEAAQLLTEAADILTPLRARPALTRAADLAARLAAAPSLVAQAPGNPDGLSPREAAVLALLAAGRSNHEIARILSISPRTVQRHVANVYLKIGAHNKAAATAYALRHKLL